MAYGIGSVIGGMVSPALDFLRGDSRAEKAYQNYLKSKGISDAESNRLLSDQAGLLADKADMAKQNVMSNLQAQGLGNSIIGVQAGLGADMMKNQSIVDSARAIQNRNIDERMKREALLQQFRLGRDQAKRQGFVDLAGQGGMLFDWLNKKG